MKRVFYVCTVIIAIVLLVIHFQDSIQQVLPVDSLKDSFKESMSKTVTIDPLKDSFGKILSVAHQTISPEATPTTSTPAESASQPAATPPLTTPALVLTKEPLTGKTESFTTLDGDHYTGVIKRVEPDGIVLRTSDGVPKLKFKNLPPEVGVKYGYDPKLEAQFLRYMNREAVAAQQDAEKVYAAQIRVPSKAAPLPTTLPGAVNKLPTSPQIDSNNLVQNGDFSQGKNGWSGDGQPLADFLRYNPRFMSTNLPANGLVIELNARNWTKLSQRINGNEKSNYVLKMKYALFPGTTLSTLPADYMDLIGHTHISEWAGFNPINLSPGQFFDTIKDVSDNKGFYEQYAPNLSSTEDQTYQHVVPPLPPSVRKIVAVAFPPGKGFVLIKSITVTSH